MTIKRKYTIEVRHDLENKTVAVSCADHNEGKRQVVGISGPGLRARLAGMLQYQVDTIVSREREFLGEGPARPVENPEAYAQADE